MTLGRKEKACEATCQPYSSAQLDTFLSSKFARHLRLCRQSCLWRHRQFPSSSSKEIPRLFSVRCGHGHHSLRGQSACGFGRGDIPPCTYVRAHVLIVWLCREKTCYKQHFITHPSETKNTICQSFTKIDSTDAC